MFTVECKKELTEIEKEKAHAYLSEIEARCWHLYGLSGYRDSRLYIPLVFDCANVIAITACGTIYSFDTFRRFRVSFLACEKSFEFIKGAEKEIEGALYNRIVDVDKKSDAFKILKEAIHDVKMISRCRYRLEKMCC